MSTPFHDPDSVTVKNLEAAFAGEAMAHVKYRYFAKLCRAPATRPRRASSRKRPSRR